MTTKDLASGNGYRLRYFDDSSGTDRVLIQRVTGESSSLDLVTMFREIAVGDTLGFSAVLRDSAGNVLTGHAVSWFSTDSSFAIVSNFGTSIVGRGMRAGSALLQATSEGKTGQATITVH